MQTLSLAFALVVCLALVSSSRAALRGDEGSYRARRSLGRRRRKRENHPVCQKILEEWWGERVQLREDYFAIDSLVTELDVLCANYDNDTDACNRRSQREAYSDLSEEALQATCSMMGSSDRRCVGNPCNQYNNGECTLQQTAGRCVWLTSEQTSAANDYLRSIGQLGANEKAYLGHGCYKNRCHAKAVGRGKISDEECEGYSIPGIMDCTYCRGGKKYDNLKGLGVGCQMNVTSTEAECAPVNNKSIDPDSIIVRSDNRDCQCSTDFPLCKYAQSLERGSVYEPRFPKNG